MSSGTKTSLLLLISLAALAGPARADLKAVVAIEPTSRKDGLIVSRTGLEAQLAKLTGEKVAVTTTEDLTDAMRATRSGGYDVFIAPAQVAASALAHGYEIVGSTEPSEQYVMVGRPDLPSAGEMKRARIYLPQQDSIYTYLARGMLNANGLSFKDMRTVEYARYPQAGLTALTLNMSDATVIRRSDYDAWARENPGAAKVLATSGSVPGGFSVAVRKDLPPDVRNKVAKWFATSAPACGMKPVAQHSDLGEYKAVAQLGTFTPKSLPGATVVTVAEVQQLMQQGVPLVDTRIADEYHDKHIPNALWLPYKEKSLKDVAFDAALDDFSALGRLDPDKPVIFQCNGPECWKSYKASRAAIAKGFKKVYWFRGGFPEWEQAGLPVAHEDIKEAKR